ncbi:MAG: DUF3325 domain-containing protein [Pseudomonas sp.]|nr:DUF3325 domain-containing protein [Pseudomonas sp.]
MMLFSACLCFLGLVLIALSMPKHYQQIRARKGQFSQLSLWVGYALLLASVYACTASMGISIGLSVWLALLTFAAFVLMFLLSYKSRVVIPFSMICLVLSGVMLVQNA